MQETPHNESSHIILERRIKTKRDMQEIEEAITKQLGGEGHRCAFLRSRAYIRLRLAALYPTARPCEPRATIAYVGHISVTLICKEGEALIVLRRLDPAVYQEEEERGDFAQGGSIEEPEKRKRR